MLFTFKYFVAVGAFEITAQIQKNKFTLLMKIEPKFISFFCTGQPIDFIFVHLVSKTVK